MDFFQDETIKVKNVLDSGNDIGRLKSQGRLAIDNATTERGVPHFIRTHTVKTWIMRSMNENVSLSKQK